MGQTGQLLFRPQLLEAAETETPESPAFPGLSEYRFHDRLAHLVDCLASISSFCFICSRTPAPSAGPGGPPGGYTDAPVLTRPVAT